MGSREEERTEVVEIETCDACGKDIPKPYPGDHISRVRTSCTFCRKVLCRDCAQGHSVLIDIHDSITACPTCWQAGAEERAALEALNETVLAKIKEHRGAWQRKAASAVKGANDGWTGGIPAGGQTL